MQNQNELTDGKLYDSSDMVKLECNDCAGCFSCCQGMGTSIVLNPYDVWLLEQNLECSFEQLLSEQLELNAADGMILPNLRMVGAGEECAFLNSQKRCKIHAFRPGLCRLFPLGRQYGEEEIKYIFLTDGCRKENRSKVKIKKWLGIPQMKQNEQFLLRWHGFQKKVQQLVLESEDEQMIKELNMYLLNLFYLTGYDRSDFYTQFENRMAAAEKLLRTLIP